MLEKGVFIGEKLEKIRFKKILKFKISAGLPPESVVQSTVSDGKLAVCDHFSATLHLKSLHLSLKPPLNQRFQFIKFLNLNQTIRWFEIASPVPVLGCEPAVNCRSDFVCAGLDGILGYWHKILRDSIVLCVKV